MERGGVSHQGTLLFALTLCDGHKPLVDVPKAKVGNGKLYMLFPACFSVRNSGNTRIGTTMELPLLPTVHTVHRHDGMHMKPGLVLYRF